jgi:hypothetical protein
MATIFPKVAYPPKLKEWCYDTDFDDLLCQQNNIAIDYKSIGSVLMMVFFPESGLRGVLDEFVEESKKRGIEPRDAINTVINNIKYTNRVLYEFSPVTFYNITEDIILFRGFRYTKLAELYKEGTCITTKTFNTTSMIEETALRFTDSVMWKIIVPKERFGIFKYTNLSVIDYDINCYDLFNSEAQILLPLGTILRKVKTENIQQKRYRYPKIDHTVGIGYKDYELVTYIFEGYDKKFDISEINKFVFGL